MGDLIDEPARQLSLGLIELPEAIQKAEKLPVGARRRAVNRVRTAHDLLNVPIDPEVDLTFNHSGLCQTSLPHTRLLSNSEIWTRKNGRFTLMIRPGAMRIEGARDDDLYIGVPFGPKARLIMFHLQTEGLRSNTVSLGKNLSAFLRSLGLEVRGGPRGTIRPIREQTLRIGSCTFTMQWTDDSARNTVVTNMNIVKHMHIKDISSEEWAGEIQLTNEFVENLREHAVPLDKRGIAMLSDTSLGLDLYALLAQRLPRLNAPMKLSWEQLAANLGSSASVKDVARKVRAVLPLVQRAYPAAKVEVVVSSNGARSGVTFLPSPAPVPKKSVHGFRLVSPDSAD